MPDNAQLISQFYIKIDGTNAEPPFYEDLVEINVESSLHLPDVATVKLQDPRLKWVDDDHLAPGKKLVITAKGQRNESVVFDGEIVEIEPDYTASTQQLTIRAFDRLHRLSRGRTVRSFQNVSDGDLIQKLAQEVGLQSRVGPTPQVHQYLLQANETNLAFLQRRAAALGYLLFVHGETLHCEPPTANGSPIEVEWGVSLSGFRPRMTTVGQVNSVTARGWDPVQKREVVGSARSSRIGPQVGAGQNGGDVAKRAFNIEAKILVADRPIRAQAVAEKIAQATADQAAGQFVMAEGECSGTPTLMAGTSLKVKSVGTRFGGTYFVTSASHHYSGAQGYSTSFSISGLHPATLLSTLLPDQKPALVSGLVIGVVTDNQDPENLGRVKVKYPWLSGDHASDWARVVSVGAGATRGIEFLPEVNDEVLVGFEQDDINYPYVLGGLWNGKDAPPEGNKAVVQSGKVQKRIIRSRTGHTIILDDNDNGGGVTIQDNAGNKIVIDTKSNALTIQMQGDTTLKTQGNLTLEAQGKLEIKGMGVKVDGGGGTVDVKGSMINLN